MTPYVLLFAYLLLVALVAMGMPENWSRLGVVVASAIGITTVTGLRSTSVGTDTSNYGTQYATRFFREEELGYTFLSNWLASAGMPFQLFLLCCAVLLVGAAARMYFHYSLAPWLSFLLYLTLGPFALSMTGLRQSIAVAIVILAVMHLLKARRGRFLLLVLLASTFHNSALAVLPLVLAAKVRFTQRSALVVLLMAMLATTQSGVVSYVSMRLGLNRYDAYFTTDASINPLLVAISLVIPVFCLILWPRELSMDKGKLHLEVDGDQPPSGGASSASERSQSKDVRAEALRVHSLLFVLSSANMACAILAFEVPIMIRLTYYFGAFSMVLLPNAVWLAKRAETRLFATAGLATLSLILFFISAPGSSLGFVPYHSEVLGL